MIKVGDLVEHTKLTGYRGIVREVTATRGNGKPRTIKVIWFPPLSTADKNLSRYRLTSVQGTCILSVLDVQQVSSCPDWSA